MEQRKAHTKGFTLIEMMIMLAIVAGVVALGMPYLSSRNTKTKAMLRELTVLSRELHIKAKLQGVVYRLVIDLGDDKDPKNRQQSFWVEKANGKTVLSPAQEEEVVKALEERDETKRKDPRGFEVDRTLVKKNKELPSGMIFEKVELSRLKAPITKGRAFVHYLPQGLVDEAAIHIKGDKTQAWTIAVHPLTGKAEVITKTVSLQEIKSQ